MQFKKVTPYLIGATVGVGLTLGGVAVAQVPGLLHGGAMLQTLMAMGLDDEQKDALHAFHADSESIHDEMRELHEQNFEIVVDQLLAEEPDRGLIHDLVDNGLLKVSTIAHGRIDAFLDIHATFSPEQRQTLVDGIEQVRSERIAFMDDLHDRMREVHGTHGER